MDLLELGKAFDAVTAGFAPGREEARALALSLAQAGTVGDGPVVDLGCGPGLFLEAAADVSDRARVGVEHDPVMLHLARARLDNTTEVLDSELDGLGWVAAAARASLVVCLSTMHGLERPAARRAVRLGARALEPGGHLMVWEAPPLACPHTERRLHRSWQCWWETARAHPSPPSTPLSSPGAWPDPWPNPWPVGRTSAAVDLADLAAAALAAGLELLARPRGVAGDLLLARRPGGRNR